MGELLDRIPDAQNIPKLLLRGSPLILGTGHHALYLGTSSDGDTLVFCDEDEEFIERAEDLGPISLDLTNRTGRTGRAHAAWWVADVVERTAAGARSALMGVEFRAWENATQNRHMTALAIDTLARLVLRPAGRA